MTTSFFGSEESTLKSSMAIVSKQLGPFSAMEKPNLLEVGYGTKETPFQMVTKLNLMMTTLSQLQICQPAQYTRRRTANLPITSMT